MSVNLEISVRKEDGNDAVLLLTRFSQGISHTAQVGIGETVFFPVGDLVLGAKVHEINHDWQPPGSEIAPNSTVYAEGTRVVTDHEFRYLLSLGFKEI